MPEYRGVGWGRGGRQSFSVTTTGVGRKDYSMSVEYAVQPIVRSHLRRGIHTFLYTLPTLSYPSVWSGGLVFSPPTGHPLPYTYEVPSTPRYYVYEVDVSGNYNALTIAALIEHAYTGDDVVQPFGAVTNNVGRIFGYGGANLRITEGFPLVAGRAYEVPLNQYSEEAFFFIRATIYSVTDEIVEG